VLVVIVQSQRQRRKTKDQKRKSKRLRRAGYQGKQAWSFGLRERRGRASCPVGRADVGRTDRLTGYNPVPLRQTVIPPLRSHLVGSADMPIPGRTLPRCPPVGPTDHRTTATDTDPRLHDGRCFCSSVFPTCPIAASAWPDPTTTPPSGTPRAEGDRLRPTAEPRHAAAASRTTRPVSLGIRPAGGVFDFRLWSFAFAVDFAVGLEQEPTTDHFQSVVPRPGGRGGATIRGSGVPTISGSLSA
jgi:hypothetical protein